MSRDLTSVNIEHGLGVAPNFYIVRVQNNVTYTANKDKYIFIAASKFNSQSYGMFFYANAATNTASVRSSLGYPMGNATTFTPMNIDGYTFINGYTYHWVCGVIEEQ